jgi:hypothetical protein
MLPEAPLPDSRPVSFQARCVAPLTRSDVCKTAFGEPPFDLLPAQREIRIAIRQGLETVQVRRQGSERETCVHIHPGGMEHQSGIICRQDGQVMISDHGEEICAALNESAAILWHGWIQSWRGMVHPDAPYDWRLTRTWLTGMRRLPGSSLTVYVACQPIVAG